MQIALNLVELIPTMLNVLRVNCSATMNEDAKSAVENFAAHLRTVLEQYQNLWDHYTQLNQKYDKLKHSIEHSNNEQHNGDSIQNMKNDGIDCSKSKIEEKRHNILEDEESDSINEHMLSVSMSDFESDLECNISVRSKALAKELQTEMLHRSPIISKGRQKFKKLRNAHRKCSKSLSKNGHSVSSDNRSVRVHLFNDKPDKIPDNNKNASSAINAEMRRNKNHTSGLEFTTSQNVETSVPQMGKKMKQSKLLLPSPQKTKDVSLFDKSDDTCSRNNAGKKEMFSWNSKVANVLIQKTPEKHLPKKNIFNSNKIETEDIIESTPGKSSPHSALKSRLILKRSAPKSYHQHSKMVDCKKENLYASKSDTIFCASSSTPLREKTGNHNIDRPLSLTRQFSKVNDVLSGNLTEGYGTMTGNERESQIDEPLSPVLIQLEDNCLDAQINHPHSKPETTHSVASSLDSAKHNKISLPVQESMLSDDTFFEPEEERIRNRQASENDKRVNTSPEIMLPPSKRIQLVKNNTSYRREATNSKLVYKTDPVRNKVERAKLNGWSCWECKEYYGELGLSEKELAIRKKQCSRHKAAFDEWKSTPDGFWNHVFPDTVSSSCEDN